MADMSFSWNFYENPPPFLVTSVGRNFKERESEKTVKIISFHPLFDYHLSENPSDEDKKFGNLPAGCLAVIIYEILSGDFCGQKPAMISSDFFRLFSLIDESS